MKSLLTIQEELAVYGGKRLENTELLSIITGINIANLTKILSRYGSIKSILANAEDIRGISIVQKAKLNAFNQLRNKLEISEEKNKVSTPDVIINLYAKKFEGYDVEHFDILLLDTKNQIICKKHISKGTLNASIVHPRDVMREAIRMNCNSIILMHNHPSGDPNPSEEDINITNRLVDVGVLIGIKILDHIVFGSNGKYVSFKEKNLIF